MGRKEATVVMLMEMVKGNNTINDNYRLLMMVYVCKDSDDNEGNIGVKIMKILEAMIIRVIVNYL